MDSRVIQQRVRGLVSAISVALLMTGCQTKFDDPVHSTVPRVRSTPALRGFESCSDLEAHLRLSLSEEMATRLRQQGNGWGRVGFMEDGGATPVEADTTAGAPGAADGGREEGVDFSGTNNQESGVDEADFVKTDGYYIYVINGNRLEIFSVPQFGDLEALSRVEVEGRPNQLLVAGDKAVVFSYISTWNLPDEHPLRAVVQDYREEWGYWYGSTSLTKISVFDLSERTSPRLSRELYLEGSYKTGRKVDATVRMVSYAWIDVPGLREWVEYPDHYWELHYDDSRRKAIEEAAVESTIAMNNEIIASVSLSELIPQLYERFEDDVFVEHVFSESDCAEFSTSDDGLGRGFSSILTLDLLGDAFEFDADHIVTNSSQVYASQDTLLIAEPAHDWWWFWGNDDFDDATNVHRFDIGDPARTVYTGSGRVDGVIRDQFALSEYEDYVRVATTTGRLNRWWSEDPAEPENNVFVLAGVDSLGVIGHLGGIAKGEQIWSSRFVGESAYLVTFRNIDPLWTIDLSDPTQPEIKGELEVPGVSTYIHPLTGHLLTIGFGGDDEGLDWKTQLSLFDVTDFSNPTLKSKLSLAPAVGEGWNYAYSEATWEHKAFQYWQPKGLLAIPLSTYRYDYQTRHYEYVSKLSIINVSLEDGLSHYGSVDHSDFFNRTRERYWSHRDVRRSIFMGDYIYAISDRGITAHHLDTMNLSVSVAMEGDNYQPYWEW
ncbi:MAG: beta-propeller domain-containing protein [Myxococcota bacterium]|nr:beta-propeller domain-containing protein [Myxococcota bacterium]